MKNNRTNITIPVHFENGDIKEKEYVKVPYDILINTFVEYCRVYKNINIDGKANDIWNFFNPISKSQFGYFDELVDYDKNFEAMLIANYCDSPYYDEDLEDWIEDNE